MKRSMLMGSAMAAAITACGVQVAAAAEAANGTTIDEVVVTARKVEESAQSVPISISVATGEQLRAQNVVELRNLQNFTPGILIRTQTSDPMGSTIVMRGIGANDVLLTTDTSVGIYIDGVYLPRTAGLRGILQNPEEVARIETLRGPQGTLFGRNTTAGALNITSVAPGPDFSAYATAAVGNYSARAITAGVNIPLGENAALRLAGVHDYHGGYVESQGKELNEALLNGINLRLLVTPNDRFSLDLSGNYQRAKNTPMFQLAELCGDPGVNCSALANTAPAGQTPNISYVGGALTRYVAEVLQGGLPTSCRTNGAGFGGCPANANTVIAQAIATMRANIGNYATNFIPGGSEFSRLGLTMAYDLAEDIQVKSITGYVKFARGTTQDLDGTPLVSYQSNNSQEDWALTQELQLIGSFGDKLEYVVGGYTSIEQGQEYQFLVQFQPLVNPVIQMTVADIRNTSNAVFGQGNYHITDKLTFTGGLRYNQESRGIVSRNHSGGPNADIAVPVLTANTTTGATTVPAPFTSCNLPAALLDVLPNPLTGGGTQGICQLSKKNNYSNLSWLGSLDYQFTDDILFFGKVTKGYRAGGQQLRGSAITASFNSFAPENIISYEAGVKSTFWDRKARVNVSIWDSEYKNIQKTVIVLTPTGNATITQNAAKARLYGADVEATLVPVDNLTLNATLAYTSAKYLDYTDGNIDRTNEPFTGTTGVPKWTYSVGARYLVPLESGDLSFQLNWRWQDRMVSFKQPLSPNTTPCCNVFANPALSQYADAYGELSGRIKWDVEDWDTTFSVFGNNLTNEETYLPGQDLNTTGFRTRIPQPGRTYGFQVSKRF